MAKKLKVLSAKKLGLTQAEWRAGQWVRKQLKHNAILSNYTNEDERIMREAGNVLRLHVVCDTLEDPKDGHKCGTAACIGGWWAIRLLGYKPNKKGLYVVNEHKVFNRMIKLEMRSCAIRKLFYDLPANVGALVSVQALDNFFAGYSYPWRTKDGTYMTGD